MLTVVVIYSMLIVLFELIAYIILFKQFHAYNQELENKNLGLSKESLIRRKRKNIVRFVGEFVSFIIETTFVIVMPLALANLLISGLIPLFGMVAQSALTIVFIMASPELKRFYVDSN